MNSPPSQRRIFIGLREVAGHYEGLCRGFQTLGIEYDSVTFDHRFSYDGIPTSHGAITLRWIRRRRLQARNSLASTAWFVVQGLFQIYLFIYYAWRCDYFIFASGESFLAGWDLPLLRLMSKRVIVQFHGSDSRIPFLNGALYPEGFFDLKSAWRATLRQRRRLAWIERFADVVINIQPQAHLQQKPYLQWLQIGVAAMPNSLYVDRGKARHALCHDKPSDSRKLLILHCPTHRASKGSDAIRRAVERIAAQGYEIQYEELTHHSHSSLMDKILQADLVIDQLYSDYPMPSLATECAWLHVPVLVCGHAAEHWGRWLDHHDIPPSLYVQSEKLDQAIVQLVESASVRRKLAEDCYAFVSTKWNPAQIAKRYQDLLEGVIDHRFWAMNDRSYRWGMGLDRLEAERRIASIGRRASHLFRGECL